ncbi:MAG: acyl carrier protein [Pseudonocardiaceae bacterium]
MDHIQTITKFVVDEFLPDVPAESLAADYDLLAGGVIDSLGLLKVIAWLEDRFDLVVDDLEIAPDNFRTVAAMSSFISNARQAA